MAAKWLWVTVVVQVQTRIATDQPQLGFVRSRIRTDLASAVTPRVATVNGVEIVLLAIDGKEMRVVWAPDLAEALEWQDDPNQKKPGNSAENSLAKEV